MLLGRTEFFNGVSWKPIKYYTEGEQVLCYNIEDGICNLSPVKYFLRIQEEVPMLEFYEGTLDLVISKTGRLLCNFENSYEIVDLDYRLSEFENGRLKNTKLDLVRNIPVSSGLDIKPRDVLQTALAVLDQDSKRMSEYNVLMEDGSVGIKDSVIFTWSTHTRKTFLDCMGIDEKEGIKHDFTKSLFSDFSPVVMRQLEALSQVTFSTKHLVTNQADTAAPEITLERKCYLDLTKCTEFTSNESVYWVEPSNGWLVIRYLGAIFVVSSNIF